MLFRPFAGTNKGNYMSGKPQTHDNHAGERFAGLIPMHPAIFQVAAPDEPTYEKEQRFSNFGAEIQSIKSPLLGRYVWQICSDGLPATSVD